MNLAKIVSWMKQYDGKELFNWIQITAIHPSNQIFQTRFELLVSLLLNIPYEQFMGNRLTRKEFTSFIREFEKSYSQFFLFYEDWQPFNQLNLIPFLLNRSKNYFFYGNLKRPFELLHAFRELFLIYEEDIAIFEELNIIKNLFLMSLKFQNKILEELCQMEETKIEKQNIYIPSQKFFEKFYSLFKISYYKLNSSAISPKIRLGDFNFNKNENLEHYLKKDYYKSLILHFDRGEEFFLIPQIHLEILYQIALDLIKHSTEKTQIESVILENFRVRLWRKCAYFFSNRKTVLHIFQKDTNLNLMESVDAVFIEGSNKIILFKAVKHSFNKRMSKSIADGIRELIGIVERIRNEEIIGLHIFNHTPFGVNVQDLEFFPIIVFESVFLEYRIELSKKIRSEKCWIFNFMDLQSIFEFIPDGHSFITLLRNDRELMQKLHARPLNFIDRFAFYLQNGESYPLWGKLPSAVGFDPSGWHNFYHQRLFEKHQDNIYELIEQDYPNTFNKVKLFSENIYKVANTHGLVFTYVVKLNKNIVWVTYYLHDYGFTHEEYKLNNFLGQLFADYIDKIRIDLLKLFERYGFRFQSKYRVDIIPSSLVERQETFRFLNEDILKLDVERPLIILTGRVADSYTLQTRIIYDPSLLITLFSSADNSGEKYCIQEYIKSLILFFDSHATQDEINKINEEIVRKSISSRKKAYSIDMVPTENPKLDGYPKYQPLVKSDISKVNKEVSEFLAFLGMKSGLYEGEQAKFLIRIIFKFLLTKLQSEIRQYNTGLLLFAYKELEMIEGERVRKRVYFGLSATRDVEFDIAEENKESSREISELASYTKYIIELILKVDVKGSKEISSESWSYLQANTSVLHDISIFYDNILYDIVPYTIKLSDLYEIQYMRGKENFNHTEFYRQESELQIESAKHDYVKYTEIENKSNRERDTEVHPILNLIKNFDFAFRRHYNFSFENLVKVLHSLGKLNLFHSTHFPLTILSEREIIESLNKSLKDPINANEVKRIVQFASLDYKCYQSINDFIPSNLLRQKKRLNLCPLIKLKSGDYIYGNQMCLFSAHLWLNRISLGDFPYRLQRDNPLFSALNKTHQYLDRELEKKAEVVANRTLGAENVEARIKKFKRLSPSFPKRPECGEIDILAVNKVSKIVFVMDAKNRNKKLRPYDIRQEMKQFFEGDRSYLKKLEKKELFIKSNRKKVLQHFSIDDDDNWQVHKAFVVNANYPSAYCSDENIDFVLIKDLAEYLLQRDLK